jgi:hypothetical protein
MPATAPRQKPDDLPRKPPPKTTKKIPEVKVEIMEKEAQKPLSASDQDQFRAARSEPVILTTPGTIRREMVDIYNLARTGKITITAASRMIFMLKLISDAKLQEKKLKLARQLGVPFAGLTMIGYQGDGGEQ